MRTSRVILITLVLLLLMMGVASAASYTYISNDNMMQIWLGASDTYLTLSDIEAGVNNPDLFRIENRIAWINCSLRMYNMVTCPDVWLYMNNTEVDEIRFSNNVTSYALWYGRYLIQNVTIGTWNHAENRYSYSSIYHPSDRNLQIEANVVLQNVNIFGMGRMLLFGTPYDIHDVHITNTSARAMQPTNFYTNIYNITVNTARGGIDINNGQNMKVYNIGIWDASSGYVDTTGWYGVVVRFSDNVSIDNVTLDGIPYSAPYSGIDTGDNSMNTTFTNMIIKNSTHNGLDIHGGRGHFIDNISIYNTLGNNILITGYDTILKNLYSETPTGDHFRAENPPHIRNLHVENLTMVGNQRGVVANAIYNSTFKNIIYDGSNYAFTLTRGSVLSQYIPHNISILNLSSTEPGIRLGYTRDVYIINYDGTYNYMISNPDAEFYHGYWVDTSQYEYAYAISNTSMSKASIVDENGKITHTIKNSMMGLPEYRGYRDSELHKTYYSYDILVINGTQIEQDGNFHSIPLLKGHISDIKVNSSNYDNPLQLNIDILPEQTPLSVAIL